MLKFFDIFLPILFIYILLFIYSKIELQFPEKMLNNNSYVIPNILFAKEEVYYTTVWHVCALATQSVKKHIVNSNHGRGVCLCGALLGGILVLMHGIVVTSVYSVLCMQYRRGDVSFLHQWESL